MGQTTEYIALPLEEGSGEVEDGVRGVSATTAGKQRRWKSIVQQAMYTALLVVAALVLGFCVGRKHEQHRTSSNPSGGNGSVTGAVAQETTELSSSSAASSGLLPPQAFIPEIPLKGVQFEFPTPYGNTTNEADLLWDKLMPKGSGFVRVPYPRRFDMPASKIIEDDPEEAEIYSLSALHQLHCLGVVRDVVKKYEQKSMSRFAGAGHEYHCIDYLRQSIMCAVDTTLDFAEPDPETGERRGFSGASSTHMCRDWDFFVEWAVENREGDKMGIA